MTEDRELRASLARSVLVLGMVLVMSRFYAGQGWACAVAALYLLGMVLALCMESSRPRQEQGWRIEGHRAAKLFEALTRRDPRIFGCLVAFGLVEVHDKVIVTGKLDIPLGADLAVGVAEVLTIVLTMLASLRDGELLRRAFRRHGWRFPFAVIGGRSRRRERTAYWRGCGSVPSGPGGDPVARLELETSFAWSVPVLCLGFIALSPWGATGAMLELAIVYLGAGGTALAVYRLRADVGASRRLGRLSRWSGALVEFTALWDIRPLALVVAGWATVAVAMMAAETVAMIRGGPLLWRDMSEAQFAAIVGAGAVEKWKAAWSLATWEADRAYEKLVVGILILAGLAGWHDGLWTAASTREKKSSGPMAPWKRARREERRRRWQGASRTSDEDQAALMTALADTWNKLPTPPEPRSAALAGEPPGPVPELGKQPG
ncbi:MAG: hypothetical protein OXE86_11255 [Alphaproteobacteria bacterium]|nr:hypothetical protein [Alphaproteobacteria bacterium]